MAIKKALVFYAGKPPKGVKTNWIMHEYRLADVDRSAAARKKTNNALRVIIFTHCSIHDLAADSFIAEEIFLFPKY